MISSFWGNQSVEEELELTVDDLSTEATQSKNCLTSCGAYLPGCCSVSISAKGETEATVEISPDDDKKAETTGYFPKFFQETTAPAVTEETPVETEDQTEQNKPSMLASLFGGNQETVEETVVEETQETENTSILTSFFGGKKEEIKEEEVVVEETEQKPSMISSIFGSKQNIEEVKEPVKEEQDSLTCVMSSIFGGDQKNMVEEPVEEETQKTFIISSICGSKQTEEIAEEPAEEEPQTTSIISSIFGGKQKEEETIVEESVEEEPQTQSMFASIFGSNTEETTEENQTENVTNSKTPSYISSLFTIAEEEPLMEPTDSETATDIEVQTTTSKSCFGTCTPHCCDSTETIEVEETEETQEPAEYVVGDRVMAFVPSSSVWKHGSIMQMEPEVKILIDDWDRSYPFDVYKPLAYEPGTYITNDWVTTRDGMSITTSKVVGRLGHNQRVEIVEVVYDSETHRIRGKTDQDIWVTLKDENDGTRWLKLHVVQPPSRCYRCFCSLMFYWCLIFIVTFIAFSSWNLYVMYTGGFDSFCDAFYPCYGTMLAQRFVVSGFWDVASFIGF